MEWWKKKIKNIQKHNEIEYNAKYKHTIVSNWAIPWCKKSYEIYNVNWVIIMANDAMDVYVVRPSAEMALIMKWTRLSAFLISTTRTGARPVVGNHGGCWHMKTNKQNGIFFKRKKDNHALFVKVSTWKNQLLVYSTHIHEFKTCEHFSASINNTCPR